MIVLKTITFNQWWPQNDLWNVLFEGVSGEFRNLFSAKKTFFIPTCISKSPYLCFNSHMIPPTYDGWFKAKFNFLENYAFQVCQIAHFLFFCVYNVPVVDILMNSTYIEIRPGRWWLEETIFILFDVTNKINKRLLTTNNNNSAFLF